MNLKSFVFAVFSLFSTSGFSQEQSSMDNSPRRFENQINRFDSLNTIEKDNENSILFIGSSYIRKWTTIREDLDYHDIINRGFGGSNLNDVAFYIKRIAYPHQPKAIFIYVGNDITASKKDKKPEAVLELYKSIVDTLRQKFPTIPITWLAIFPSEKRWAVWDKIQQVNDLINEYSLTQPKLYFINVGNTFLGEDGYPRTMFYSEDKLHFNADGYKLWGKMISKKVREITEKSK